MAVENVDRFNSLAASLDDLVSQSEAEMAAFNDRSAEIENEFAEGLARLEVALGQLSQLSGSGAADVHQGDYSFSRLL